MRNFSAWRRDLSDFENVEIAFNEQFALALQEIDMSSTPGNCILNLLGPTNKDIFLFNGVCSDPDRVDYVKQVVRHRFDEYMRGEAKADPLNMFIKIEPTKLKKIQAGAYRVISGVSLVDNLVDRILFGWINRAACATPGKTPCMVGWSPLRGGWKQVVNRFRGKILNCLDKSAWDWTYLEWMVRASMDFVLELPVNAPDWWKHMVKQRFTALYRDAEFRVKDGTIISQSFWGIQKSGSLLTLIINSIMQDLLDLLAFVPIRQDDEVDREKLIMGDDTSFEEVRKLEEYVRRINSLGPLVKEKNRQSWVEFAGFAFLEGACWPTQWRKHLYNLKYTTRPIEYLHSMQVLYAHDPDMFAYLEREISKISPTLALSRVWCKDVFDREG